MTDGERLWAEWVDRCRAAYEAWRPGEAMPEWWPEWMLDEGFEPYEEPPAFPPVRGVSDRERDRSES